MSWWEEFCMQFPCIGVGCKVIKYSLEKNIVSLGFAVVKDADGLQVTPHFFFSQMVVVNSW